MISKYNHKEINWIDLESPSIEEVEHVLDQYPVSLFIKDMIISGKNEDKIDISYDFIYVSLMNKIIFVVSDKFVLTIHSESMVAFNEFSKEMELDVVGGEKINNHQLLFAYLLKNIYKNNNKQLISNENQIKNLQKKILKKDNKIKKLIIFIILIIISLILSIWL